jgi:RNA polymerase sigma-70 factor, ECF subfamily
VTQIAAAPAEDDSKDQLLQRLHGDPAQADEVLLEVFARYRNLLLGQLCRRWGATTAQAEDVLQEAFLKARKARLSFRGNSTIATWINTIARNTWFDQATRAANKDHDSVDEDESRLEHLSELVSRDLSPEQALERKRREECVDAHYSRFERDHPERAEDLDWVVTQGLQIRELANRRGIDEPAMRKRMQRSRELLRNYLTKCVDYFEGSKR